MEDHAVHLALRDERPYLIVMLTVSSPALTKFTEMSSLEPLGTEQYPSVCADSHCELLEELNPIYDWFQYTFFMNVPECVPFVVAIVVFRLIRFAFPSFVQPLTSFTNV